MCLWVDYQQDQCSTQTTNSFIELRKTKVKYYNHLKAIHYFSVAAEHLSIKQASESLFVTQAAISQQIRSLESALGVTLFHRQHRALSLTREGTQLLPHLKLAFEAMDKGIDHVTQDKNPNVIRLAVFPSFASRWLIPRLASFYKQNPTITINLSMSDKYESFGDGIDLGIRFIDHQDESLKNIFLMKEYIYPACHPLYAKEHNIQNLKDLKKQRLLEDVESILGWDYWLEKKKVKAKDQNANRVRYDGSHYVTDAALSAQGVAMVRHSLVAEAISQQQLLRLFDEVVELDQKYFLCAPAHYYEYPKIKIFSDWLIQEINDFQQKHAITS